MAVMDSVTKYLPRIDLASVGKWAYWGVFSILILIIISGFFGLWVWWYISKRRYVYTIKIFNKVDGRYQPTMTDKAMERKIGTGGDTIFYFKKLKKIVPRPSIQTGINTFWFARRSDGEYINIGMEDIDLKMREANVYYNENEQRYARASLQKLNKDRFNKETFWQKYGRDIMTIVFIIIISVMILLITSKLVELVGKIDTLIKSSAEITTQSANLLGKMDTICGNSGLVKA